MICFYKPPTLQAPLWWAPQQLSWSHLLRFLRHLQRTSPLPLAGKKDNDYSLQWHHITKIRQQSLWNFLRFLIMMWNIQGLASDKFLPPRLFPPSGLAVKFQFWKFERLLDFLVFSLILAFLTWCVELKVSYSLKVYVDMLSSSSLVMSIVQWTLLTSHC